MTTPLLLAIDNILNKNILLTVIQLLLNFGADPNVKNNDGQTALSGAGDEGHEEIVKILIEAGAQQ